MAKDDIDFVDPGEGTERTRRISTGKNGATPPKDNEPKAETPVEKKKDPAMEPVDGGNLDEEVILKGQSQVIAPEQQAEATPLTPPVLERAYSQPTFQGDTKTPMAEPVIQPQNVTPPVDVTPKSELTAQQQQEWEKSKQYAKEHMGEAVAGDKPANPAVATMSNKEKKDNLDMTVDTVIYYYCEGKLFIGGLFVYRDSKLMALETNNELRIDWAVLKDNSTGEVLTLRKFIVESNTQMIEACRTSEEFKQKIRAPLRAELERRGLIASPENNLMLLAGWDLFNMVNNLYKINTEMKNTIKRVKDEYEDHKKLGVVSDRQAYNNRMSPEVIVREIVRETTPVPPQQTQVEVKPSTQPAPPVTPPVEQPIENMVEVKKNTSDQTKFKKPGTGKKEE